MIKTEIRLEPRVVQHLGQDLITSAEVAVTELLKNSIDAQASQMNIHLYNTLADAIAGCNYVYPVPSSLSDYIPESFSDSPLCIIEDNGIGMSPLTLNTSFLSIGTSNKSGVQGSLGEKGIGRLSTQRLGTAVLVETQAESTRSFLFLDWSEIIGGNCDVVINDYPVSSDSQFSYTRLWIFCTHLDDFLEIEQQTSLYDTSTFANRDLKTALCFLISPFYPSVDNASRTISMYYMDKSVDIRFESEILECAETKHYFSMDSEDGTLLLKFGLVLQPWYVERIHLSLLSSPAFDTLKQPHQYYREFIDRYSDRLFAALNHSITESELIGIVSNTLERQTSRKKASDDYKLALYERAKQYVKALTGISPISSNIYSFKQKAQTLRSVVLESISERHHIWFDSADVKNFLSDNNGVKLYRGSYRIGFLGSKENDWVKLQQFRTKGPQFYRFDLGNTVGYVSINDPNQEKVREISSRLDLIETTDTTAFKLVINIIFNQIFYDLNRTANALIKNLLQEEGLLVDSLEDEIKKNSSQLKELQRRTKEMQRVVEEVEHLLSSASPSASGNEIILPVSGFQQVQHSISKVSNYFIDSSHAQNEAIKTIESAQERLDLINADLYNNYKLMANGMITETITHELDSISKTSILPDSEAHFNAIRSCLLEHEAFDMFTYHLRPIQNSYRIISGKLNHVADLYNFLDSTFIHKGSYDVFEEEMISTLCDQVTANLSRDIQKANIQVICTTGELTWYVPRGVLLHVLYNLFTNSAYWINMRKRWANEDPHFRRTEPDFIRIDSVDNTAIIVSDSGTGVIKAMEDVLFDPLQSGKNYSERRGMGLYIVKMLLNSFGADICLLSERNAYGNRYRFLITLREKEVNEDEIESISD